MFFPLSRRKKQEILPPTRRKIHLPILLLYRPSQPTEKNPSKPPVFPLISIHFAGIFPEFPVQTKKSEHFGRKALYNIKGVWYIFKSV